MKTLKIALFTLSVCFSTTSMAQLGDYVLFQQFIPFNNAAFEYNHTNLQSFNLTYTTDRFGRQNSAVVYSGNSGLIFPAPSNVGQSREDETHLCVSFWVKYTSNNMMSLFYSGDDAALLRSYNGYLFLIRGADTLKVSDKKYNDDKWHHIFLSRWTKSIFIFNENYVYFNGGENFSVDTTSIFSWNNIWSTPAGRDNPIIPKMYNNNQNVYFGTDYNNLYRYNGAMDDIIFANGTFPTKKSNYQTIDKTMRSYFFSALYNYKPPFIEDYVYNPDSALNLTIKGRNLATSYGINSVFFVGDTTQTFSVINDSTVKLTVPFFAKMGNFGVIKVYDTAYSPTPFKPYRTGINETEFKRVNIYPNPVLERLIIENMEGEVSIRNIVGEVVYSGRIREKRKELNLEYLTPGLYFLIVPNQTIKFIKQ